MSKNSLIKTDPMLGSYKNCNIISLLNCCGHYFDIGLHIKADNSSGYRPNIVYRGSHSLFTLGP